jgi:hypothetical protein
MLRWEAMTPDERWVSATPAEMAAVSLESERGSMILEDLKRLPASPLILVEGTPLLPTLVAAELIEVARAVWLIPTAEFERARLEERAAPADVSDPQRAQENRIQRELIMRLEIERLATELGLVTMTVDGSRTVEEMAAAVELLFADALAAGPRAETVSERRRLIRDANQTIASQLVTHFARMPASGDADSYAYPFACECGDPRCEAVVELAAAAFPTEPNAEPVLAAGHN